MCERERETRESKGKEKHYTRTKMGCKNRELPDDEGTASSSMRDALLFTTMCIIGLPVDVFVKDGSIYTGIFHTACVENGYGVVLKRAVMTKKGKTNSNVADDDIIETLVVLSGDLVQVVAKGVLLPAGAVSSFETLENEGKTNKSKNSPVDKKQSSEVRNSVQHENGLESKKSDGIHVIEVMGSSCGNNLSTCGVGEEKSQGNQDDKQQKHEICEGETTNRVRSSSSGFDSFTEGNAVEKIKAKLLPDMEDSGTDAISPSSSTSVPSTEVVPPQSSVPKKISKEFKLNPGAKIFSPSFANPRSATSAVPAVQPEIGINHKTTHLSLPVKFVPYGIAGGGDNVSHYTQAFAGSVGSRTQSGRRAGQYQPIHPAYGHPSSQNVMVGRLGQLVHVHPVSHDIIQGATAFSQVSARPLLASHHSHHPKFQGPAAALCVAPNSYLGIGQQPLAVPNAKPHPVPYYPYHLSPSI